MHAGCDVVVSIQDDGRGIDRAAVRAKAVEKQLIAADASLSDKDIFNLILMPGFSTARQVTSVSGRGVGMDAVKRQIDALRGALSLASEEGKGTRVSITLPLTLAIIEGLLVQIGGDQFIVPMAAVTENVELLSSPEGAQQRAQRDRRARGTGAVHRLAEDLPHRGRRSRDRESVVIVQHEDHRVGLVVDRVLGTHQTVIQSLGKFFRNIDVVSGATIMGDGRVALIMDIAAVVRHADRECREAPEAGLGREHGPGLLNPPHLPDTWKEHNEELEDRNPHCRRLRRGNSSSHWRWAYLPTARRPEYESGSQRMYHEIRCPGVYLVDQIQKQAYQYRWPCDHCTHWSRDPQEMARIEAEIRDCALKPSDMVAEYEKLIANRQRPWSHSRFQGCPRRVLGRQCEEMFNSSRIGSPESIRRTEELLKARVQPAQKKYAETAEAIVTYNRSLANDASAAIQASVVSTQTGVLVGLAVALIVAIVISLFVVRSLTRPLASAVGLIDQVAKGDLTHTVDATSTDELGQMLMAMNGMVGNLNAAAHVAVKISEGDLTVQAKALSEKDVLGQALMKMLENLRKTISDITWPPPTWLPEAKK